MIRLSGDQPVPALARGAIVALGNFDGFHVGHQAVVGRAIERARAEGRPAMVATFDPHPARLFRPDAPPFLLTTIPQRMDLFEAFGADAKAIEAWGKHWTTEGLATYERLLARRAPAPFALGATPGLADICIAGQVVGAHFLKLGLEPFPAVAALAGRCFAMPAFATSHPFEQPGYKTASTHH